MCHVQAAQASHTLFTSSSLDSQIELSANHNPTNRELVHNFLTDLKKISASLSLTNNPPPPLIEFRVNWPFPRQNEVPWSVYVSTVFIISLLPSLTLEVFFFFFFFCRMQHPVAGRRRWWGEADGGSQLCVNAIWKHTVRPSVMHFHQLTFADILCPPIYSSTYNATNQYCKYWRYRADVE